MKKNYTIQTIITTMTIFSVTICSNGFRSDVLAATPKVTSPDGEITYECGPERQSAAGCYNAWTKTILSGKEGNWVVAYCRDQPNEFNSGECHGGGVPWWWWKGKGKIGDPVLEDFWFRDYAGPRVNGVTRNDNHYGNAYLVLGSSTCYKAKESTFCMKFMNSYNVQN